ncbi:MAG TPA: hypothetical protein VJI97_03250 [Candidatus Nanoarchaeia archaeon]|nr:hypothetical protein [Candidatus Nanoarchaeia archaeon]
MTNKLFSSKKASELWAADTFLWWIVFTIAVGFAAVGFSIFASQFGSGQAQIKENLESYYMMQRFTKSPDCFAYNPGGIIVPNTIDAEKFTDSRLQTCYDSESAKMPAFRLTLTSDKSVVTMTKNWNGQRQSEVTLIPINVQVYSQGKISSGELKIEIQNLQ